MESKDNIDYKKLWDQGREYLRLEWDYGTLTALEKLTVLLSSIAVIAIVTMFGALALFFLMSTLVELLTVAMGAAWLANCTVAVILLLMMWVVYACRKAWIIDPIARFLTRLFLTDNDNTNRQ